MNADIELICTETNGRWFAYNEELEVSGFSWQELEEKLTLELSSKEIVPPGRRLTVLMMCDPRVIPAWMRPYQSHYFNRLLSIQIPEQTRDRRGENAG